MFQDLQDKKDRLLQSSNYLNDTWLMRNDYRCFRMDPLSILTKSQNRTAIVEKSTLVDLNRSQNSLSLVRGHSLTIVRAAG